MAIPGVRAQHAERDREEIAAYVAPAKSGQKASRPVSEPPTELQRRVVRLAAAAAVLVVADREIRLQRPRRPQRHVESDRLLDEGRALAGLELDALVPLGARGNPVTDLHYSAHHRPRHVDAVVAQRRQPVARAQLHAAPG